MLQPQNPWLSHLLTLWPPHLEQSRPRHQALCYSLFLRKPTQDISLLRIFQLNHTVLHSYQSVQWVCACLRIFCIIMLEHLSIYDLVPKGAHARGHALQLKIKHCWKLFLFEMLCCVLAWMNEYIVVSTDNFSNQAGVDFKIQSSHTEKRQKMTTKNGHPCTEWFSSLCLQTNRKHMEKQSLICTGTVAGYWVNNLIFTTLQIHWHDQGMLNWVYSWAKWYSKEENIKHSCRWYRERLAADWESTSWRDGGGGGGGGWT